MADNRALPKKSRQDVNRHFGNHLLASSSSKNFEAASLKCRLLFFLLLRPVLHSLALHFKHEGMNINETNFPPVFLGNRKVQFNWCSHASHMIEIDFTSLEY